jgi:hypothetical protein
MPLSNKGGEQGYIGCCHPAEDQQVKMTQRSRTRYTSVLPSGETEEKHFIAKQYFDVEKRQQDNAALIGSSVATT